jgi:DNA segregation ATPase FtsK/SpoIIIE-like protein
VLRLGEQFGLVLNVQNEPRLRREGGLVAIEVPVQLQHRFMVRAEKLPSSSRLRVPVGVSTANLPVFVNFNSPNYAHALVAGMTGSGKTELLRSMIYALARQNVDQQLALIVIDGKNGFRYLALDRLAHLLNPVIVSTHEAIRACLWVVREIEQRKHMDPVDVRQSPRIVVFIDEVRHVLVQGGDEVVKAITAITELGREFGVHVILSTHRPNKTALGSVLTKANLGARLVFRVGSAEESAVATGRPAAGAEKLIGSGDCLVGPQLLRVQAPIVDDEFLAALPRNGNRTLGLDDFDCGGTVTVRQVGAAKKSFTGQELASIMLHPDWGIRRIQTELSMGSDRATRLRDLARTTLDVLAGQGYELHSVMQGTPAEL